MTDTPPSGDRIAKVLSSAGIASRRDAERMIAEGRVSVNGKVIVSPALNVTEKDRIVVDGKQVAEPEPARLWLYHKPSGLVTTTRDEKDRETVFDTLPADMPRVMAVGRLDLTSEGLLLLTNDGELKRKLELPSTGWLRRYRVRAHGTVTQEQLDGLKDGIAVDGVLYGSIEAELERQQGSNVWLTFAMREGKNREIRRALLDQLVEEDRVRHRLEHIFVARAHEDEMLDRAQMCARPGDQGHEGLVEKDRPIGRIVADEGKLFGMQSRVQRMAHITSARDGEPDLQMPVVVPRERSNAIALLQAERFQSRCQFSRGYGNFAPSRPVDLARGLAADDLCVCMIPSRMNDQIADQKIFEHHRTKHVVLLVVDPFAIVRTKTALARSDAT